MIGTMAQTQITKQEGFDIMKIALYSVENEFALKKKYFKALNNAHISYHKENITFEKVEKNNVTVIDVNTVEELFTLSKEIGHELVLGKLFDIPEITIYDDYME